MKARQKWWLSGQQRNPQNRDDGDNAIIDDLIDDLSNASSGEPQQILKRGSTQATADGVKISRNPNSSLSKILSFLGIKQIVYDYINEAKKIALQNKLADLKTNIYSSEKQIIAPAKINEPFSILHKSFLFLLEPIPFLADYDFMFLVASIESPIWWVLYGLTLFKLIQFGIVRLFNEPVVLTIVFFLLGFIFRLL